MGEASVTVPTNETLLVVDGHSLAFRAEEETKIERDAKNLTWA